MKTLQQIYLDNEQSLFQSNFIDNIKIILERHQHDINKCENCNNFSTDEMESDLQENGLNPLIHICPSCYTKICNVCIQNEGVKESIIQEKKYCIHCSRDDTDHMDEF